MTRKLHLDPLSVDEIVEALTQARHAFLPVGGSLPRPHSPGGGRTPRRRAFSIPIIAARACRGDAEQNRDRDPPPLAPSAAVLLALISLAGCAAAPDATRGDPAAMVAEVSAMSGLPWDGQPLPEVVPTPRLNMDVIALFSNLSESCAAIGLDECRMHGGYSHAHREIVIATDIPPAEQQAVLAHELVHYLQGINGVPFDEPQAYAVQRRWEAGQ